MIVQGIQCPECGEKIWSRHAHDFHPCGCGYCAIDGGREYTRIAQLRKGPKPKRAKIDTEAPAKCPSCNVALVDHVGVSGTCAALQCALSTLDKIAELNRSPKLAQGLASSCATFIRTTLKP